MSKDAYYFPHDSNARQDVKILKLRIKHGWAGYGLYWGIIEALRDQDNYAFEADQPELISLAVGCSVMNSPVWKHVLKLDFKRRRLYTSPS